MKINLKCFETCFFDIKSITWNVKLYKKKIQFFFFIKLVSSFCIHHQFHFDYLKYCYFHSHLSVHLFINFNLIISKTWRDKQEKKSKIDWYEADDKLHKTNYWFGYNWSNKIIFKIRSEPDTFLKRKQKKLLLNWAFIVCFLTS